MCFCREEWKQWWDFLHSFIIHLIDWVKAAAYGAVICDSAGNISASNDYEFKMHSGDLNIEHMGWQSGTIEQTYSQKWYFYNGM